MTMSSIVIHLIQDQDGQFLCTDSICDAYGYGTSPQEAIVSWVDDVFAGYKFLVEHQPVLGHDLERQLTAVQKSFFPEKDK